LPLMGEFVLGTICFGGIYAFFLAFGFAQEHIYELGDKKNGDGFVYSIFLVFIMCNSCALLSFVMLLVRYKFRTEKIFEGIDRHAVKQVMLTSITYVISMLCTNYSLGHVNYPTQVLVKSAMMIPIVLGGFLVFGTKYPWYDYVAVGVLSVALAIFNSVKARSLTEVHQTAVGLCLLIVSLVCDGLTGPRQDKLLSRCPSLSPLHMMFLTNAFSVLWTGLATGLIENLSPFHFCIRHPAAIPYILAYCVCACFGQVFIFLALKYFGSLYLALITTSRKFASVLFSVVWFGHHMSPTQWGCVGLIFSSLALHSYFGHKEKTKVVEKGGRRSSPGGIAEEPQAKKAKAS